MNRAIIVCFFFSLSNIVTAQDIDNACVIQNSDITISKVEGTLITNPQGNVTVNNFYFFDLIDALDKSIDEGLKLMDERMKVSHFEKVDSGKTKKELEKEEEEEQSLLNDHVKDEFKKEIAVKTRQLREINKSLSLPNSDNFFKKKLQEFNTKTESLLSITNDCLINDHEIVPFKDRETGEIKYGFSLKELLSDPNYIFVDDYVDGLARIKRNNKYGYIDRNGKLVIPFKYDHAESFSNDRAIVKNLGNYYLIDNVGKEILTFPQETNKVGYFNKERLIISTRDGCCLADLNGEILNPCYRLFERFMEEPNLYMSISDEGHYGLVDSLGKVVIPHKFEGVRLFGEDKYIVKNKGLYTIYSTKTKFSFPSFKYISFLDRNQLIVVKAKNDLFAIVNINGDTLLAPQYDQILRIEYNKELYYYTNEDSIVTVFRSSRNSLKESNFFEKKFFSKYGLLVVSSPTYNPHLLGIENKFGILDKRGNFLLGLKYSNISDFNELGYAIVEKSYRINLAVDEYIAVNENLFCPGRGKIKQVTKSDIIDNQGNFKLGFKYSKIWPFDENGLAIVIGERKRSYGVIDGNGHEIIRAKFDLITLSCDQEKGKKRLRKPIYIGKHSLHSPLVIFRKKA